MLFRSCHKLGFENYRKFQLALARDAMEQQEAQRMRDDCLLYTSEKYDLIIVGAGPAGIFTAVELLRRGSKKHILLVEKGKPRCV